VDRIPGDRRLAGAHPVAAGLGASVPVDAGASAPRETLIRVLILADDLTGAADCAAAFLGRAARVTLILDGRRSPRRGVVAIDLDTRSRTKRAACRITRRAFRSQAAKRAPILFKKIDSTLRGHVAAELAAARAALGRERPVITVVGSASRVSLRQAAHLSRSPVLGNADLLLQLEWAREPAPKAKPAVRRLGRLVAECAPRAHYVLTGGETARAVLDALWVGELQLLGEVEPGVPFGLARGGALVCTKAGAFGTARTLVQCVARLKREMKR
jgi:uncharacterized protein YgbK (DUF1537 family)